MHSSDRSRGAQQQQKEFFLQTYDLYHLVVASLPMHQVWYIIMHYITIASEFYVLYFYILKYTIFTLPPGMLWAVASWQARQARQGKRQGGG